MLFVTVDFRQFRELKSERSEQKQKCLKSTAGEVYKFPCRVTKLRCNFITNNKLNSNSFDYYWIGENLDNRTDVRLTSESDKSLINLTMIKIASRHKTDVCTSTTVGTLVDLNHSIYKH